MPKAVRSEINGIVITDDKVYYVPKRCSDKAYNETVNRLQAEGRTAVAISSFHAKVKYLTAAKTAKTEETSHITETGVKRKFKLSEKAGKAIAVIAIVALVTTFVATVTPLAIENKQLKTENASSSIAIEDTKKEAFDFGKSLAQQVLDGVKDENEADLEIWGYPGHFRSEVQRGYDWGMKHLKPSKTQPDVPVRPDNPDIDPITTKEAPTVYSDTKVEEVKRDEQGKVEGTTTSTDYSVVVNESTRIIYVNGEPVSVSVQYGNDEIEFAIVGDKVEGATTVGTTVVSLNGAQQELINQMIALARSTSESSNENNVPGKQYDEFGPEAESESSADKLR